MSIVLIGYRGSGKSCVGRRLAETLRWEFVDTDERIVAAAEMSIREIFEKHGEEKFRELESAAVREAIESSADRVIALGGGAVVREENRQVLKRSGHSVIYLHADAQTLHDRIHADPATAANRPGLTKLGGSIEEIRQLLDRRLPLYRAAATHEIDVTHMSPEQVADRILQLVGIEPGPH